MDSAWTVFASSTLALLLLQQRLKRKIQPHRYNRRGSLITNDAAAAAALASSMTSSFATRTSMHLHLPSSSSSAAAGDDGSALPEVELSATSKLIDTLGKLKAAAAVNFDASACVYANIGDVSGLRELEVMKAARRHVAAEMNSSTNQNAYPPYNGLPALRAATARDLLARLRLVGDADADDNGMSDAALVARGVLRPGETVGDLVAVASGSVGCSGSIYAHLKYQRALGQRDVVVGIDRTAYWKHAGVGNDVARIVRASFMTLRRRGPSSDSDDGASDAGAEDCRPVDEGQLEMCLNVSAVRAFAQQCGGGVLVLNFANPTCFLPSSSDSAAFVGAIVEWNRTHGRDQQLTVIVDGPYDDFDDDGAGYRFVSLLFRSGVTTSYAHARTKEELATGGRCGEVLCNNPLVRQLFTDYKADYIGSDSRMEQEMQLYLHAHAAQRDDEKRERRMDVRERKEYFWSCLTTTSERSRCLRRIVRDTAPFYRVDGAFYVFLNVRALINVPNSAVSGSSDGHNSHSDNVRFRDAMDVCMALAREHGVILVPGTLFSQGDDACDVSNVREVVDESDPNRLCPTLLAFSSSCVRVCFSSLPSARSEWQAQIKRIVAAVEAVSVDIAVATSTASPSK